MQTIKTWQERTRESLHPSVAPNLSDDELSIVGTKHMLSYIADLESALASQAVPADTSVPEVAALKSAIHGLTNHCESDPDCLAAINALEAAYPVLRGEQ